MSRSHREGEEAHTRIARNAEVPLPQPDQVGISGAQRGTALAPATLHRGHAELTLEQVVDLLGAVMEVQADGCGRLEAGVDGQLEPAGEEMLLEPGLFREDPLGEVL